MQPFTTITILYNPHSTGSSGELARQLERYLISARTSAKITVVPTQHAGHAETLAYQIAKQSVRPLVVSSSGDGGYHEVINGALKAQAEGAHPTTAVLPAGNANDHYNCVSSGQLETNILHNKIRQLDVLQVRAEINGKPWVRYAHSYVGLGISPQAGHKLTNAKLNRWNEIALTARTFLHFRSVAIKTPSHRVQCDSLLVSNVQKMAKYLLLAKEAKPDDGKFELTLVPHTSRLQLLYKFFRAVNGHPPASRSLSSYHFTVLEAAKIQLDGEVYELAVNTPVEVTAVTHGLRCVV